MLAVAYKPMRLLLVLTQCLNVISIVSPVPQQSSAQSPAQSTESTHVYFPPGEKGTTIFSLLLPL